MPAGGSPRLEEMATLVRVVDEGGFARAARASGRSTSAVSKQIRTLEERLGAQLLHRTTRALALTETGRRFFERSREILAEVAELTDSVRGLADAPRGTLRISAPHDFGRLQLCGAVSEFAGTYPELRLDYEMSDRLVDVVEEGFDLAVRIAPVADSTLVVRRLAPCRRVLCASPGYLERHGDPRDPADLAHHACIEYAHLTDEGWRFVRDGKARMVRPRGRVRTNAGWAMREMVLAGEGLALLPTFLVGDDLRAGSLRTVLDEALDADVEVVALYPATRSPATKVRLFIDFLVARMGPCPAWDAGL